MNVIRRGYSLSIALLGVVVNVYSGLSDDAKFCLVNQLISAVFWIVGIIQIIDNTTWYYFTEKR